MLSGYYYLGCSLSHCNSRTKKKFEENSKLSIIKIFRKGVHLGTKYFTNKDDQLLQNFVLKYNQLTKTTQNQNNISQSNFLEQPRSQSRKLKNYTEPIPRLRSPKIPQISSENLTDKKKRDAETKATSEILSNPFLPDSILKELDQINQQISFDDAARIDKSVFSKNSINKMFGNFMPANKNKAKKFIRTSSIEDMEKHLRSTEDLLTEIPAVSIIIEGQKNCPDLDVIRLNNLEEVKSLSIEKRGTGVMKHTPETACKYNNKSDEERYFVHKPRRRNLEFEKTFLRRKHKHTIRPQSSAIKVES
jgi:hypothetical protein